MKNNNPDFQSYQSTAEYISKLMNQTDISQMLSHDVELTIRGINRRLESYGKIMYQPAYIKEGNVHLTKYDEILTELRSIVMRVRDNKNILGAKGNYVQISRSKKTIDDLKPYLDELKDLYNRIPSFQETKERIQQENGRKMKRTEILDVLKRESDIENLSDYITILGMSDQIGYDSELAELIKPFRGEAKGGTRKKGEPVPQEAVNALIEYLRTQRMDILSDLKRRNRDIDTGIEYARDKKITFGNNSSIRGEKDD